MTLSLTNESNRRLNVVLPPGLIASGATGQFGGMGGMGGGMVLAVVWVVWAAVWAVA